MAHVAFSKTAKLVFVLKMKPPNQLLHITPKVQ